MKKSRSFYIIFKHHPDATLSVKKKARDLSSRSRIRIHITFHIFNGNVGVTD